MREPKEACGQAWAKAKALDSRIFVKGWVDWLWFLSRPLFAAKRSFLDVGREGHLIVDIRTNVSFDLVKFSL